MNFDTATNQALDDAATAISAGGVIGYPTEGVFGLGCDPLQAIAVNRLIELKRRDVSRGFIVLAAEQAQLEPFMQPPNASLQEKFARDWPGPVTWIVPRSDQVPALVHGDRNTIAVRVTAHPIAAALCQRAGCAIISTSANFSGSPACTQAAEVTALFSNQLDCIINAATGGLSGPTAIFDAATGNQLR